MEDPVLSDPQLPHGPHLIPWWNESDEFLSVTAPGERGDCKLTLDRIHDNGPPKRRKRLQIGDHALGEPDPEHVSTNIDTVVGVEQRQDRISDSRSMGTRYLRLAEPERGYTWVTVRHSKSRRPQSPLQNPEGNPGP